MANVLKTDHNQRQDTHRCISRVKAAYAKSLHKKITKLQCPFTENADETWIIELMFNAGEPRIKILQWLLSKFDQYVYSFLDSIHFGTESRLKALLHVASGLGLCRPTDLELIEGKTSFNNQMAFIDKLLDMAIVTDDSESYVPSPSKYTIRSSTGTDEQYNRDCELVDSISQQQPLAQVFPSHLTVLPADITRGLQMTSMALNSDRDDRQLPTIQDLTQRITLLQEDLSRQSQLFEELNAEHTCREVDRHARHTEIRKMRLVMSELQQMMVNFNYCYENHIQMWCNRECPSLSALGTKIHTVQRLLTNFTTVLGAMKVIKVSHEKLDVSTTTPQPDSTGGPEAADDTRLYQALDNLEQRRNT